MVSALDSGSGGPGSSTGWGTALRSWARHFILIVPLSTQVYKWVHGQMGKWAYCWGQPCDGLASHPGGSRNTLSPFMLRKLG